MFLILIVLVAQSSAAPVWDAPRSVIGSNDLIPIGKVENKQWYRAAQSVGRVDSGGAGYCSVFRISPDLFMTNQHCAGFKPCSEMVFHLGYEPEIAPADRAVFQCQSLLHESLRFDYAVFRGVLKQGKDQYPVARLFDGTLFNGMPTYFASYPGTFTKQMDLSVNCQVVDAVPVMVYDRMTLRHACDTMSGSSGAPIFEKSTGNVVAIHWGGKGEYTYNHAILMRDVLGDLKQAKPEVYAALDIVH